MDCGPNLGMFGKIKTSSNLEFCLRFTNNNDMDAPTDGVSAWILATGLLASFALVYLLKKNDTAGNNKKMYVKTLTNI